MSNTPTYLDQLLEREDLSWAHIGDLHLPTGDLVLHDALSGLDRAVSIELNVEPGTYPVLLGLRDEEEIAFAMVDFSGAEIMDWRPSSVSDSGKPQGFTVASGVVALMDEQARAIFVQRQEALRTMCARRVEEQGIEATDTERWQQAYREQLRELVSAQSMIISAAQIAEAIMDLLFVELMIDEDTESNMLAFRPAQSEGTFATWVGFDDEGQPAILLADFGMLADEEDDITPAAAPVLTLLPGQELVKFLIKRDKLELIEEPEVELRLGKQLEPLMRLPLDDEHRAIQIMEFLLDHDDVEEVYLEESELAGLLTRHF